MKRNLRCCIASTILSTRLAWRSACWFLQGPGPRTHSPVLLHHCSYRLSLIDHHHPSTTTKTKECEYVSIPRDPAFAKMLPRCLASRLCLMLHFPANRQNCVVPLHVAVWWRLCKVPFCLQCHSTLAEHLAGRLAGHCWTSAQLGPSKRGWESRKHFIDLLLVSIIVQWQPVTSPVCGNSIILDTSMVIVLALDEVASKRQVKCQCLLSFVRVDKMTRNVLRTPNWSFTSPPVT